MTGTQMSSVSGEGSDAQKPNEFKTVRAWLAIGVTGLSILLAAVLGFAVIRISRTGNDEAVKTSKDVLNVMLPLFGTWVGTVLAFYFAKENFEAAQKSVADFARQVTGMERLQSMPAKDKMIPKVDMVFKVLPRDQNEKVIDILNEMTQRKKGMRLPVLSDKDYPLYVIHRSMMDRYLVDKGSSDPAVLKTKTLQNLLDDNKDALQTSFVTLRGDGTLANAKAAMDSVPFCEDAFVTKSGTKDDAVLGWITNVIIRQNSRV